MDRREAHVVAEALGGGDARERLERGLRGEVGGEARRDRLHAERADVDDVALPPRAHARQQRERQADGAEVVQAHRALVVVEAVVALGDRAADRARGVVDEHVDDEPVRGELRGERVDRVHVGEVGRVRARVAAGVRDLAGELARAARRRARRRPSSRPAAATCSAAARPIPYEAPVIRTTRPETAASSERRGSSGAAVACATRPSDRATSAGESSGPIERAPWAARRGRARRTGSGRRPWGECYGRSGTSGRPAEFQEVHGGAHRPMVQGCAQTDTPPEGTHSMRRIMIFAVTVGSARRDAPRPRPRSSRCRRPRRR